MPETPPKGIYPIFLRGVTCEKYGLKTGEGVNDLVEYINLSKEEIQKEIQTMGVMSDFEPAKKIIDNYHTETILFVIDKEQKYGETFLLCYTDEARDEQMKELMRSQDELREQLLAEQKAEEERREAEFRRQNVVYEDKPLSARDWQSTTVADTENEIVMLTRAPTRELITIEVTRPKRFTKLPIKFSDRNADVGGLVEMRAYKDPNFKSIRESDMGIQVAAVSTESAAQTVWHRAVNKAVQYEPAKKASEAEGEAKENLLSFLERAVMSIEHALQQNESVDIFNDTFRLLGEDEAMEGTHADSELRELKNFADPNYSKSKVLAAIDWMPKAQGMVAVSAVRNISFDQRVTISGQTFTSYVLLWDFRLLVKPLIIMQAQHEIFTFRFNKTNNNLIAGGCITGQIVLWDISDAMAIASRKTGRGPSNSRGQPNDADDEDLIQLPVAPKLVSNVDHSHKRCVADLFWLPPATQINHRGQLVGEEHLDGNSYQFVTVAADGLIMVWDIRYEQIFNDELRHIGRAKHVPTEKSSNKEANVKPLWGPIFKAHLKRLEGVGELSLCKVCEVADYKESSNTLSKPAVYAGDNRSQFMVTTEEGDIILTDLSARKAETKEEDEDDDGETAREYVKWIASDHPRPSVSLAESPFFPQIMLSVSDWNFHLWKVGESKPVFVSPLSENYLTAGAWSTTRPAVLYVSTADGNILVWDFTDTSFHPSIELKATHSRISSMEFLQSSTARQQLLAVGDEVGTLHIFEIPRNLIKPVHKEDAIMLKFLDREVQRISTTDVPISTTEDPDDENAMDETDLRQLAGVGATLDLNNADKDPSEEALLAEQAALTKEEEEFLKLEAAFISELNLAEQQLPSFAQKIEIKE